METEFFSKIDDAGAQVRDRLLSCGAGSLTTSQRSDWARLLMSLGARHPTTIERVRTEGERFLRASVDDQEEVRRELALHGILERPSDYLERTAGWRFEDRALLVLQGVADHPKTGAKIIEAIWDVLSVDPRDQPLVLGDKALLRVASEPSVQFYWAMPLSPEKLFVAASDPHVLETLRGWSPRQLAKRANRQSVWNADEWVFSTRSSDHPWIETILREKVAERHHSTLSEADG